MGRRCWEENKEEKEFEEQKIQNSLTERCLGTQK